jgi:hypothetical protein
MPHWLSHASQFLLQKSSPHVLQSNLLIKTHGGFPVAKKYLRLMQVAKELRSFKELELLSEVWPKLSPQMRAGILVMAGVLPVPEQNTERRKFPLTKRGETPSWLLPALNILKDSNGRLSDREIARRLGISSSTMTRNQTYLRAREAYYLSKLKGATPEFIDIDSNRAKKRRN